MHFKRINHKLNFLYILSISIPLFLFANSFYISSKQEIESKEINNNQNQVKQINHVLDEIINQLDTICLSPYLDPTIDDYLLYNTPYNISKEYSAFNQHTIGYTFIEKLFTLVNKNIRYISLVDYNNNIISKSRNGYVRPNYDFTADDYFEGLRNSSGDLVILPTHFSKYMFTNNRPVFTVGRKIYNYYYFIYIGYIYIEFESDSLSYLFDTINNSPNNHYLITDLNNNYIYSTDSSSILDKNILDTLNHDQDIYKKMTINKEHYLITKDISSSENFIVYGITPYNEIEASLNKIKITFYLLTIVCIILVLLISYIISKHITKPIHKLQRGMKLVEHGDTTIQLPVTSKDELGQLTYSFNHLIKKLNTLIVKVRTIQLKKREAELTSLRSQVNPHFLYNTLDSIRMMALLNDQHSIASSLEALAGIFRYSLKYKRDFVTIAQEMMHIEYYISLHQIRYDDRLKVHIDVDDTIRGSKILKFTLQPLIENCFIHGFDKRPVTNHLSLLITLKEKHIFIRIVDNGQGIEKENIRELLQALEKDSSESIGLTNIHQRYKAYFGEAYTFYIESVYQHYTCITLKIPAFKDEKEILKNVNSFFS